MIQLHASYRSIEADITSVSVSAQNQSLALQQQNSVELPDQLNKQEKALTDQVSISPEAIQKFEEAKRLEEYLRSHLDRLKENSGQARREDYDADPAENNIQSITGRSTNLAATITKGTIKEEALDIAAEFDDNGKITSLSISKSQTTIEFIKAEAILEDQQFYAL